MILNCARRATQAVLSCGGSASKGMRPHSAIRSPFHDVYDQTRQRFREEVCRFVGHAFTGCRDGLYFVDFGRIE